MNILKVPLSEVKKAWPVALPLLKKANTEGAEMCELEVYCDLINGTRQLWLGESRAFACLTEIHREPSGTHYVLIYMLGGEGIKGWYVDFFLYLCAWARVQRATRLQIDYPRPGWKRLLSSLGFKEHDQDTLIKEIA